MVSYVTSAASSVVGFVSNTFAPVLALKTSQSAVISTIAKAVLNKYFVAGTLAAGALFAFKNVTIANLKADWAKKDLVQIFKTLVTPLALGGAAAIVAIAL